MFKYSAYSVVALSIMSLVACGGGGGSTTPTSSTPTLNVVPSVSISGENTVVEFESLTLTANATDSDGTIDSILWSVKSGPEVTLTGADSINLSFTAPDVDEETTLVLEVAVTDNDGAVTTGEFSVVITPITNTAPSVSILGENTVEEFESLTLTANATDSDGTIDSILWSVTLGPDVTLTGADSLNVSFIAPDVEEATTLVLEVAVTDNEGLVTTQEFSVTITPPPPINLDNAVLSRIDTNQQNLLVINDNDIYMANIDNVGQYQFFWFEDGATVNSATQFSDISGVGYSVVNSETTGGNVAESAVLNATYVLEDNKPAIISGYQLEVNDASFISNNSLSVANLITSFADISTTWKDIVYTSFSIDNGLNLSASDTDGCNITGTLADTGEGFFTLFTSYTNCTKAGDYSGVLTIQEKDDSQYINWVAFDGDDKGVFGKIDTTIDKDEAIEISGELQASLYVSQNGLLVAKSGVLYTLDYSGGTSASSPFRFSYTYDAEFRILEGEGTGFQNTIFSSVSTIAVSVPPASDGLDMFDATITYDVGNGIVSKTYNNLDFVPETLLLDSLQGEWGSLTITENGALGGAIQDCTVSGNTSDYTNGIADITITLSGCSQSGDHTGIVIGIRDGGLPNVSGDSLLISAFNIDNGEVISGIEQ